MHLISRLISNFLYLSCFTHLVVFVGAILVSGSSTASHIVGGQLEMRAIGDKPGHFNVSVTYYFDENQTFVPRGDDPLPIFRKRDNQYIGYVVVYNYAPDKRPLLPFTNQPCATQRNLAISVVRYSGETQLNPDEYTDPQGYYITYQTCCRNGGIDNIQDPVNAGYVFYLEFPPLLRTGKPFANSSPIFDPIDGEYICINEPFTFDFDAHDPDGDELRYSLVTPLQGFQTTNGSQQVLAGPYPQVHWLTGYNPANAIPGSAPLRIDSQSGQLSVTASRLGLFVFAVLVEEYRKGERIGAVQRDYQLLVVDCPPTIPPDPTITSNDKPVTEIQFCEGKTIELKASTNASWDYQWKKDGKNIPGATTPTLAVTASGTYQLTTSLKAQCSKTRRSNDVRVTVTTSRFKLKATGPLRTCGPSGTVSIEAITGGGLTYQWYVEGKQLAETSNAIIARQPGRYWAIVRDYVQGCTSVSDTVQLIAASLPIADLTAQRNTNTICSGDSLMLIATNRPSYRYQWSLDGKPLTGSTTHNLFARQQGQYMVAITDTTGCQIVLPPFSLSVASSIRVSMDSVLKQCGLVSASRITLKGLPVGGFFSGPGVVDDQFDPRIAGIGHHTITYTLKSSVTCQGGIASRTAIVSDPLVALIPNRSVLEICADDSLILMASSPKNSSGYQYAWFLNSLALTTGQRLVARQAGRYQVNVIDIDGCTSQSQPYLLTITPTIQVTMDTLPSLCGIDYRPIKLSGYPVGGIFSGPGVKDNFYDPRLAGIGVHTLHYTVSSPFACQNGTATQVGIIKSVPIIKLGPDQEISRGSSIKLNNNSNTAYQYIWSPPAGLDNPAVAAPEASPQQTTSYIVKVQDKLGCVSTDSIMIYVYESIWIPDAFSPNSDGLNDQWELRGIENYPQAEVTIFNRWGEIVYFSQGYKQPFDGKYQNQLLSPGVYTYQIKPALNRNVLRGSLILLL